MAEAKRLKIDDGVLKIKKEFRKEKIVKLEQEIKVENQENVPASHPSKEPSAPINGTKSGKRERGQNKAKERFVPCSGDKIRICHILASGTNCEKEDCKLSHDIDAYLATKGEDLGDKCPNFETFGKCRYGLRCRFLKGHKEFPNELIIDETEMVKNTVTTLELKNIRKNGKFPKSKQVESLWDIREQKPSLDELEINDDVKVNFAPVRRRKLDLKGKTYLAPLQTVGNLPFRRICKEYGVDVTCTEMVLSQSLLNWSQHEWSFLKRHKSEDFFGIQVTGNHPITFTRALECIDQSCEFDFIDINLGCPVDSITNGGSGSALMQKKEKLQWMIRGALHVMDCPVTVKMRTAIRDKKMLAESLIPLVKSWGASAVTLHGRSKEQRYTKLADWDYIQKCGQDISSDDFSFFGNGDVCNPQDYFQRLEECSNVDGVMIGRGALIKPWIFKEIKEKKLYDISATERLEIMKKYANYGMEIWGSDTIVLGILI